MKPETCKLIDKARLERFLGAEFHLRNGKGKGVNGEIDACAVQAADWLAGGDGSSDAPPCVCPVIRAFVIRLNDSRLFMNYRDELKAIVPELVGTYAELSVIIKRANISAEYAAEYAEYAAESAESAAKYAEYAAEYAEYAAKYAEYAAESAAESAESAAESAESAAELRLECIQCIRDMIACQ